MGSEVVRPLAPKGAPVGFLPGALASLASW